MDQNHESIFFGVARQINSDFDFAELMALRNGKLNFDKERSVREGIYVFTIINIIILFINIEKKIVRLSF